MKHAIAALLVVLIGGCGGNPGGNTPPADNNGTNNGNPNNSPMDAGDTTPDLSEDEPDTTEDEPDAPLVECEPNSVIRCLSENSPAIEKCNFRGNQTFITDCEGRAVCRTIEDVPTCVEVECIPNTRVCIDENTPGVCDDEGSEYVPQESCSEGVTCSAGACLDPCELADQQASYIGCEYWPVELDNNLLFDPGENSTPNAPFAVVLSNPQEETARVTVRTPEGTIMDAITEVPIPGLTRPQECTFDIECGRGGECLRGFCFFPPTTVRTEVLTASGERVGEPIEGPLEDIEVPPGGTLQIPFPRMQPEPYVTSVSRIAWHIKADRPIVAYQFNPICCNFSFTNDASILLPRGALTKNYYAMTYPTWNHPSNTNVSLPATLTIVAIDDDTEVTVELGDRELRPSTDPRLEGQPDSEGNIVLTLDAQEVLNLETAERVPTDLTGAKVTASKPVAVFGGHACTFIPFHQWACDHIEQQLFPAETWGRNYILAPLKLRGPGGAQSREATYWKFLARKDDTQITLDRAYNDLNPLAQSAEPAATPNCRDKLTSNNVITLQAGEHCEFGTQGGLSVDSNHPILVGAFMSGQFSTGLEDFGNQAGDPAFFLVPPQEQYRQEYDILTPPTYALDYVTVIIQPGTNLMIDGAPVDPMDFDPEIIESQNYIRAHIPLDDGPHRIEANAQFGIIVYAYDDFVSYAYTGGLNLTKLPEELEE